MEKTRFQCVLERYADQIEQIRKSAHEVHENVNQTYGKQHPYGYHLDMVAKYAEEFGHLVCVSEDDVVPMLFGVFYHDSIEDARLSYNDVKKIAARWMNDEQVFLAAEIVYALTNDKGRTRAERAGEKYYAGIRAIPYAPFLKLCDRLANVEFSCMGTDTYNSHMCGVYREEMPHFLAAIMPRDKKDARFDVPQEAVARMDELLDRRLQK